MTPKKQVDFIEKISRSYLGLDGMKIVVLCDRWREKGNLEDIIFDKIGKECIKQINGEYIKQKYNIKDAHGIKNIGELLRKERIEWIKKNVKRD